VLVYNAYDTFLQAESQRFKLVGLRGSPGVPETAACSVLLQMSTHLNFVAYINHEALAGTEV